MESYRIIISGKVQHVYYRKFVSQALMRLGIQGYIKNLSNGTVEVVVTIYEDDFDTVMEILKRGSPLSEVSDIITEVCENDDLIYDGFEIRYT